MDWSNFVQVQIKCLLLTSLLIPAIGCAGGGGAANDEIVRVSRQNNSGTYAYFRETVLGKDREFKLGSIDQSGSKDVVELVSKTPNAIGYSGMGYATPEVKMLSIDHEGSVVAPTSENAANRSYPLARGLYIYILGQPEGAMKHYLDWVMSSEGQAIVEEIGYVPVPSVEPPADQAGPPEATIKVAGSDTMVNLAQAWAERYHEKFPDVNVQVSGGGSGVGIAKLIDGTVEVANASRDMKDKERDQASGNAGGKEVIELTVALDALAVYVHKESPLDSINMTELAEIYGDGASITHWSQVTGWPSGN